MVWKNMIIGGEMSKIGRACLSKDGDYYEKIACIQNELVSIYGKNLKLKWINKAYADYFQRTEEDLVGRSFLELVPHGEIKKLREVHRSLSIENPTVQHIDETLAPDGSISWFEWKNIAIFDENNKFIEFRAVGRDVTELVELRKKLQELECSIKQDLDRQNAVLIGYQEDRQVILKVSDIFYIEAELKCSRVKTIDGFVAIPKSIGRLEKELKSLGFFRIHRSYIASLDKIEKLETIRHSKYLIYFKHIKDTLEASKIGAKKLRDLSDSAKL